MSDLDLGALESWLVGKMPGGNLRTTRIGGGQSNPTWFVDWGQERMVLRKKPDGPILRGAHAVEREFRVMRALENTQVPVPRCLWLEEDESILGTPFYLMERVEGRVFDDATLPGLSKEERREIYLDMARTLARMHAVRPDAVGLSDYGKPGNYFERQMARWGRQYRESPAGSVPQLDELLAWLSDNMPEDDGAVSLAHGDFRIGNMLFHPSEPRVVAVLDWELSTLGHPLADLGFCVMPWQTSPEEYGGLLGTGWENSGIPTRAEFEAEYHAHALPTAPLMPFHVAFALFRFAVIFVGIADRARAGSAASDEAASLEPLIARFAQRGLEAIEAEPASGLSRVSGA